MRYVSSAYLDSKLPGVTACKSAASTTYMAGPMKEPCAHCILCSESVLGENSKASYRHSLGCQAGLFYEGELSDGQCQRPLRNQGR